MNRNSNTEQNRTIGHNLRPIKGTKIIYKKLHLSVQGLVILSLKLCLGTNHGIGISIQNFR